MAKAQKREPVVPKEVLREFIKENNLQTAEDVQNALKDVFSDTLQEMLEAEMAYTLGYKKDDDENKKTENRRNGHSEKTVRSQYGDVTLQIPRDRDSEFEPIAVKKHQKNITGIEDQILALYAKGVTTRDIQDHLQQLYGIEASPALISNIINKIMPVIKSGPGECE